MKTSLRKIYCTEDIVKGVLQDKPYTRNDDGKLFVEVCNRINPLCTNMDMGLVMSNLKDFGLPSPWTVSRARRKLQEHYAELRAVDVVTSGRNEQEAVVVAYAKGVSRLF